MAVCAAGSTNSICRRAKSDIRPAIPPALCACGMEINMKVLIYKWKVYNYPAITAAFESMGHRTKTIEYDTDSGESRQAVVEGFADEINDFTPDIVFTVNYFGELSDACQTCGIPYISWTCDSPLIAMYHGSVFNDVNFIFIFDKVQY